MGIAGRTVVVTGGSRGLGLGIVTVKPVHLIALPGSLRSVSTNRALLQAACVLAPEDISIDLVSAGTLPHFNADLEVEGLPEAARTWRAAVAESGGLLVSCPEYAGGIPGSFKNALDWLVGEPRFYRKPVAIFNASQRSRQAQDALRLVLRTMSADIVEDASLTLSLLGTRTQPDDIARDIAMSEAIRTSLAAFGRHIRATGA